MADESKSSDSSGKDVLAWLSFMAFFIMFVGGGGMWIAQFVFILLGPAADEPVGLFGLVLLLAVCSLVAVLLFYAAVISWLCFAKLFFSRAEVEQVVFAGPTSPIEQWLVNTFFPPTQR
jgi:hypothetical protein